MQLKRRNKPIFFLNSQGRSLEISPDERFIISVEHGRCSAALHWDASLGLDLTCNLSPSLSRWRFFGSYLSQVFIYCTQTAHEWRLGLVNMIIHRTRAVRKHRLTRPPCRAALRWAPNIRRKAQRLNRANSRLMTDRHALWDPEKIWVKLEVLALMLFVCLLWIINALGLTVCVCVCWQLSISLRQRRLRCVLLRACAASRRQYSEFKKKITVSKILWDWFIHSELKVLDG